MSVTHNDRDVEFHMLQNQITRWYENNVLELMSKSCEQMAEELIDKLSAAYPGRTLTVEVSEDGECGAILCLKPSS